MSKRFIKLSSLGHRLFKVYLPLLLLSGGLSFYLTFQRPAPVQAAAPVTRILYDGVYTSAAKPAATVTAAATTPACSPDRGFQPAAAFAAAGQSGLIQRTEPVYDHKLFGSSADQLASLSRQCSLIISGDNQPYINAYTSYWIGWQYSYSPGPDGLCRISDPAVLVDIHQALPSWAGATGQPGLNAQWQTYLSAVTAHENGHFQLIRQYSSQLLSGLQSLPATDCASMKAAVDNLSADYLSQLKTADAAYEAATQNGATQGAIVP